jgi:predicted Rdx family selenoprotein
VATELCDGRIRQTDITLTPVHEGRFEIYINGQKVYDRKEAGDKDFLPSLREIGKAKQVLAEAIESATQAQAAAGSASGGH